MSKDSRPKLLRAAVHAFGTKGFHGTTTRDIAERAGMSPAAIYVHHRSKEELLYAISLDGHRLLVDAITRAAASSPDPVQQLRSVVRAWVRVTAENLEVAKVVKDELDALSPEHLDEILGMRRTLLATVNGIVEEGVRTGAFATDDAHLTARAFVSLGMDVPRWYRAEGRWQIDEIADHFAALALRAVRP